MTALDAFVRYLQWTAATADCPSAWKAEYIQGLREKAIPAISSHPDLAAAAQHLSTAQMEKALLSPSVIWSLREQSVPPDAARHLATALQDGEGLHARDSAAGIRIDFDSPFWIPGTAPDFLQAVPERLRDGERARIDAALSTLRRSAPRAFEFVSSLTVRIVVRARLDEPDYRMFGSLTEYPGTTILVNPWSARLGTTRLIDVLVHENIHHAIAMYEAVQHDLTGDIRQRLRSPWTGNELTCHQFVEACFVWWGLYRLWASWPEKGAARPLLDRAATGFVSRPGASLVQALGAQRLPPDTEAALLGIDSVAAQALESATPTH